MSDRIRPPLKRWGEWQYGGGRVKLSRVRPVSGCGDQRVTPWPHALIHCASAPDTNPATLCRHQRRLVYMRWCIAWTDALLEHWPVEIMGIQRGREVWNDSFAADRERSVKQFFAVWKCMGMATSPTLPTIAHAAASMHIMAKPSGSTCNIDCKYCFFL